METTKEKLGAIAAVLAALFVGFVLPFWGTNKEKPRAVEETVAVITDEALVASETMTNDVATAEPVAPAVDPVTPSNRVWTFNVRVAGINYKPAKE